MKKIIMNTALFLCLTSIVLLSSCIQENFLVYEESSETRAIGDYISNNFDLSLFYAALEKTGVLEEVNGNETITVFAPTNTAYNAIGIYRPADFDKLDKDSLTEMLRYHILDGTLIKNDVPDMSIDTEYPTRSGNRMFIAKGGALYVNGVASSYPDIMLSNGVLHIMRACLKYREGSVQDFLENRNEYSLFVTALRKFGYWEQLAEPGPWTIIAPDNQAFEAAEITLQDIEALNPEDYYKRLFGTYVFKTQLFSNDFMVMHGSSGGSIRIPISGDEDASSVIRLSRDYTSTGYPWNFVLALTVAGKGTTERIMSPIGKLNWLTDNGVIHDLPSLVVTPEEALINSLE